MNSQRPHNLHASPIEVTTTSIIIIVIIRLSSKYPNILLWRISASSSQLQWSRLVHSMRQLVSFLKDLGIRISAQSGDERESAFLFQTLSVVIQRFNAILLHNSFEAADHLG